MLTSRAARKPIDIPKGVEVKINNDNCMEVKGPKGNLLISIHENAQVTIQGDQITVGINNLQSYTRSGTGKKLLNSIPGTIWSQINNAVIGVSTGFERKLNLVGIGYRAQIKGKILNLALGYSHPIEYTIPEGVVVETPVPTEILVKGPSKKLVGDVVSDIKQFRKAEPYKGKGVIDPLKPIARKETKKK